MSADKQMIKCKFCSWQTPKWRTNKQGQRKNNYSHLQNHFMVEHTDEYVNVMIKLDPHNLGEINNDTQ